MLQWESVPDTEYEIQFAPTLPHADWHSVTTLTSVASVTSWKDDGDLSGTAPLTSAAPQRYYRIRQVSR